MSAGRDQLLDEVRRLFAERTGYDLRDLDPSHHLESDLGIDTIKQAEIFSELRQRYGLPRDEKFRLADAPTLAKVADYVARQKNGSAAAKAPVAAPAAPVASNASVPMALLFGGRDKADVLARARAAVERARRFPDDLLNERDQAPQQPARLAFVAASAEEARHKLEEATRRKPRLLAAQGIYLSE